MVHFFFGELLEGKGMGGSLRKLEVYDSVSAVCEFKSGTVGTIRLSGTNLNTIDFWDVEGMEKPDMDFTIDHVYGKGHDTLYQYISEEKWDMFPSREDVLSGIRLMERLSY
jgi:UDP-N-acetyl-2-amino-2-deoxyglucuronate dehydrogenase